jgi:hypothetical protein
MFIPGWTSRGQATVRATAAFWSLATLVHVPGGVLPDIVSCLVVESAGLDGIVVITMVYNIRS